MARSPGCKPGALTGFVGSTPTPSTSSAAETRKVGVLIRFEPGDARKGVEVRSLQSPPRAKNQW